jgi:hypothetical protein
MAREAQDDDRQRFLLDWKILVEHRKLTWRRSMKPPGHAEDGHTTRRRTNRCAMLNGARRHATLGCPFHGMEALDED